MTRSLLFFCSVFWILPLSRASDANRHVSLNGEWTFSVHGHGKKPIRVPSTFLPVGGATLEREFDLPAPLANRRALLRFDGIVMTGEVILNGAALGRYGPYTPFTIDVTDHVATLGNRLRVELTDIGGFDPWGLQWVTAFPRYGGIIRDVTLELKAPVFIKNVRLDYKLADAFTRADCRLRIWVINTAGSGRALLSGFIRDDHRKLRFKKRIHAPEGESYHTVEFSVAELRPWSPEDPHLYDLHVNLVGPDAGRDRFQTITGFKELEARGRDFFLNGKKLLLKGIFRHDIYGDQGHTLTRAQMEAEIADIKSLGCNFLRLGHYPQHGYITELAARTGLLTSGEPPIFGMDQKDPAVIEAAKFCLGGLIRRDWNNPAAAVWILSNEVGTDLPYMKEMVSFVRELDPNRLVSIVDHKRWTEENAPWEAFREAGIDFICQNAYGASDGYYEIIERFLPGDLPYVISEWGGPNNSYAHLLQEGQYYLDHSSLRVERGPRIAGIFFWEYQDIPLQNWTEEGLLHWAIVDQFRRPYETYYALKSLYTGRAVLPHRSRALVSPMPQQLPRPVAPDPVEKTSQYELVNLSGFVNSDQVIAALNPISPLAYPGPMITGKVAIAGLPFALDRQLVALSRQVPKVRIPLGLAATELEFLGHVCFNSLAQKPQDPPAKLPYLTRAYPSAAGPAPHKGYPHSGEFGEQIGAYMLIYADGTREVIPLLNGIHFADYRLFHGFSPIDAVAVATERVLKFKGDYGTATYQMRLFSYRPEKPETTIDYVEFHLKNFDYIPILTAITALRYFPGSTPDLRH